MILINRLVNTEWHKSKAQPNTPIGVRIKKQVREATGRPLRHDLAF